MAGTALTLDAINNLLSSSKTRGDYRDELVAFANGEDIGIEVDLSAGSLAGKDAKNVATGFNNARKKMNEDGTPSVPGGKDIKVLLRWVDTDQRDAEGKVIREGHVFLINTAKLGDTAGAGEDVVEEGNAA